MDGIMNDKVAIYCRLSKEDNNKEKIDDDSESIQNQKLLLTDYAMSHSWQITDIYSDDDYSGLDNERPHFKQMIKDAEKGKFNIILCKSQSRFSRNMEIIEKYIHNRFPIWGIRFIGIVDNIDTDIKGNKKARQIYGLTNEWYCEDLSDNIKSVFLKKMKEGQYLGAFAPHGYKKDPENHHRLIIDEEAAIVIREIYRLYLQGYGCKQIANILTERKVLTPSAYKADKELNFKNPNTKKFSENYGIWANNTVSRILKNRVYIGTLIQGRERKVSYKSKKVIIAPESEWITIKNNHESIIDEDTFEKVQVLRSNRRTAHTSGYGVNKGRVQAHVLAGKVKCLDCGHNLNRSAKGRNCEVYLKCQLAIKTKKEACTYHTIKLNTLIKTIENKIREMIQKFVSTQTDDEFEKEFCLQNDSIHIKQRILENEYKTLISKQEALNRLLATAYTDKIKGLINEIQFSAIGATFRSDMDNHNIRLKILETEIEFLNLRKKSIKDIGKIRKDYTDFEGLTHEMVSDFIDFIEVGEKNKNNEQEINIHWLF